MIGASASAGFVLSEPFGGSNTTKCKLSFYVDAAIIAPHAPVTNLASALVFMNPEAFEPLQIIAATNARPTLVIAVDYLFWFCYGEAGSDAERAQRFEHGLKLLEQIPCPLVVGDIPDASAATNNTGIISVEQVASETARHAANKQLKEWAAVHRNVVAVPLAEFMRDDDGERSHEGARPDFGFAGKTRALLQADELWIRPRAERRCWRWESWMHWFPNNRNFRPRNICWDRQLVFQKGYQGSALNLKNQKRT